MTWVKICGITRAEDGVHAVECGADAIGLVFAASPRRVSAEQAREIVRACRNARPVECIGVFVDAPEDEVLAVARQVGLSGVQLHGSESPHVVARLRAAGFRTIKAFRIRDERSLQGVAAYPADALLLDAWSPAAAGGTGHVFDWSLARHVEARRPLVLAGGLRPDNVRRALTKVRPDGVDVSSGVEAAPGIKDPQAVQEFIAEVRRYDGDATAAAAPTGRIVG